MERQHSDRCDSKELDPFIRLCINASDQNTTHTPESEELQHLRRKNQELLNINKEWAEQYSALRQHFEHKITELKRTIKRYEQRTEETFTMDTKVRRQEAELRACLLGADGEIERLRLHIDTLSSRVQQRDEEILRLNKVLERRLALQHERKQTKEDIWKHQAQVYKEDFFKERKDREKLMAKYTELEKRFKMTHDNLLAYKLQVRWTPTGPSKGPTAHI